MSVQPSHLVLERAAIDDGVHLNDVDNMHEWLQLERRRVADGGATAKAIGYSLGCWTALTRNLHDGAVGLDNNYLEPWQMGRKAWRFAGSELAGQRAAVVMSLVQSARSASRASK